MPPLFYDIAADPDELVNHAGDPAHTGLALDYAQRLLSWRMAHAEPTLTGIRNTYERPAAQR